MRQARSNAHPTQGLNRGGASSPVDLPAVERLGVESDGGRVAALGAADGHLAAKLYPGHGKDGAGVGARQREDVLLVVLQEAQDACEEEKGGSGGGMMREKQKQEKRIRWVKGEEEEVTLCGRKLLSFATLSSSAHWPRLSP